MINCYTAAGDVYLRTGVGLDRSVETEFTDRNNCSSTSPAALYGCGLGHDGEPWRSVGDFGTAGVFELGFGYTDTPVHRFELLVEYRPHLAFHGRANFLPQDRQQHRICRPCPLWWSPMSIYASNLLSRICRPCRVRAVTGRLCRFTRAELA